MFAHRISICTPTYNRAHTLPRTFESLCRQKVFDFEWIIIDDGSVDETASLVQSWISRQLPFVIRYYKQENGGKMRAVNYGLKVAEGELFLILDSDDFLTDNAVVSILEAEAGIHNRKDQFAGLVGLKSKENGSIIGTSLGTDIVDATMKDALQKGLRGDHAEVWYTEIFRRHPFPEIPGEKFISEGVTWLEICEEENMVLRWIHIPLMVCEYLSDGYSSAALRLGTENPKGVLLNVHKKVKYLKPSFRKKLKLWRKYYIIGRKLRYSHCKIRKDLEGNFLEYSILLISDLILRTFRNIKGIWKRS